MNATIVSITLGREELAFLLRLLKARTMPGLGDNPLEGLSDGEAASALISAERSLRARGIIQFTEESPGIRIDEATFGLLGTCVVPHRSILVSILGPGGVDAVRYYHISPNLSVEHSFPEIGLNRFTAIAEAAGLLSRIEDMLDLKTDARVVGQPFHLDWAVFERAQLSARNKQEAEVKQLLVAAKVKAGYATACAKALIQPLRSASIVRMAYDRESGHPNQVDGFSIIQASKTLWSITPEKYEERDSVYIETLVAGDVIDRVEKFLTLPKEK